MPRVDLVQTEAYQVFMDVSTTLTSFYLYRLRALAGLVWSSAEEAIIDPHLSDCKEGDPATLHAWHST